MNDLSRIVNGVRTLAIVCFQWGDTGKGKFVDFFAEWWADIIVRGTGGSNAGHTIRVGDKEYILHLVPSGILHDAAGKVNIIGSGVAFDPRQAIHEIHLLAAEGIRCANLKIALNAKLVLPHHMLLDRLRESSAGEGRIGTTGRGIGPVYVDHVGRSGLIVNDMLNPTVLARKLKRTLAEKKVLFDSYDPETARQILQHPDLGSGAFWDPRTTLNTDATVEQYVAWGKELSEFIDDTDEYVANRVGRQNILLEGAQGNLLSVDHGTYPYVTSSDCSVAGLAKGAGLHEHDVDLTLGIVKAFYMTRVGRGPFPTELGGPQSDAWCNQAGITAATEMQHHPALTVNDPDPFLQGIAIRRAGKEYGATTGRPRRVGWLDIPLVRLSRRLTGLNVILTKLDVLSECDEIPVCYSYEHDGPWYRYGRRLLYRGARHGDAIPDCDIMQSSKPRYTVFPGWNADITGLTSLEEAPEMLCYPIQYLQEEAGVNVVLWSVGPDRQQTILANDPILAKR